MFVLSWIRGLYKALSADAAAAAVAFGIAFGLLLGSVPLLSGLGMLLIALILVVRVQLSSAIFALVISKSLAAAGLVRLYLPVGETLLENAALRGFWTWFLNLPVIAWLDLDRYAVTGGAAVGIVLGAVLFWPIVRGVTAYRAYVHNRLKDNKFFKWLTNFFVIKALRFIFVGPR